MKPPSPARTSTALVALFRELSPKDAAGEKRLVRAIEDPVAFVAEDPRMAERRMKPRKDLPWLVLVDRLGARGRLAEFDWKEDPGEIVTLLDATQRLPRRKDRWAWVIEEPTDVFLERAGAMLRAEKLALVALDTGSDTYSVLTVPTSGLARIQTLVRATRMGKLVVFGLRKVPPLPAPAKAPADTERAALVRDWEAQLSHNRFAASWQWLFVANGYYALGDAGGTEKALRTIARVAEAEIADRVRRRDPNEPGGATFSDDEREVLGAAYMVSATKPITDIFYRHGFLAHAPRGWRHTRALTERLVRSFDGRRLAISDEAGARVDAKKRRCDHLFSLFEAVDTKNAAAFRRALTSYLRQEIATRKGDWAKFGSYSWFAAALCHRMGGIPKLPDDLARFIPTTKRFKRGG